MRNEELRIKNRSWCAFFRRFLVLTDRCAIKIKFLRKGTFMGKGGRVTVLRDPVNCQEQNAPPSGPATLLPARKRLIIRSRRGFTGSRSTGTRPPLVEKLDFLCAAISNSSFLIPHSLL